MPASDAAYRSVVEHLDQDSLIEMVRGALRVPSQSGEEEAAARYFVDIMGKVGLESELQPVPESWMMPASYNAVGRSRGSGGGQQFGRHPSSSAPWRLG